MSARGVWELDPQRRKGQRFSASVVRHDVFVLVFFPFASIT